MKVDTKWMTLVWLILVFGLGCESSSEDSQVQAATDQCLASHGQPCDCGGGVLGTWNCVNNVQLFCAQCPQSVSPDQCTAQHGQPCDCGGGVLGTWNCVNNSQLFCEQCPIPVSPDQCTAQHGQPCDCGGGIFGTWNCVNNNQLFCAQCPQNVSGNPAAPTGGTGGEAPVSGSGGSPDSGTGPVSGTGGVAITDAAGGDVTPLDAGTTIEGGTPVIIDAQVDAVITPVDSSVDSPADPSDALNPTDAWPATGRFPPVDDVWAEGPFRSVTVNNTGPGNVYTLFHPSEADLAPNGALNPIVSWGNGAMTNPSLYPMLPRLATHGFVVIAANNSFVTAEEIRSGIDWLIEQNQNASSPFYQKLDETNVAAMGYSLGSLGTFQMAGDPRLTTTVHVSGGAGGSPSVLNLHEMAAFFCDELQTAPNCDPDFEIAPVPVFYGIFHGSDHVGTMLEPHASRVTGAVTGWLRWRLMADETQRALFVGADCGLCTDPNWTVKQKDMN